MDATVFELRDRQTVPTRRAEALPAAVPALRAEPAPEAARASTPPRPAVEGGTHAAAASAPSGLAAGGPGHAMHKRLLAEVAARAAASLTALAA